MVLRNAVSLEMSTSGESHRILQRVIVTDKRCLYPSGASGAAMAISPKGTVCPKERQLYKRKGPSEFRNLHQHQDKATW
jgi:hypothetical protein